MEYQVRATTYTPYLLDYWLSNAILHLISLS